MALVGTTPTPAPPPMSPREPPSPHCAQPAGLSTAESDGDLDASMSGSSYSNRGVASSDKQGAASASSIGKSAAKPQSPRATTPPPPKRSLFSVASPSKRSTHYTQTASEPSPDASITNSAPTILIHAPSESSDDPDRSIRRPLRSSMSARTIHESLHRGMAGEKDKRKMDRSVSFANVNIREYERVLGDNPSVTCGPPLSLGWRYSLEPVVVPVEDYEDGKGLPRQSSEFLVPKAVRESMLKEHADVSRREMVHVVRVIQKEKAQRRKTVVNLGMSKTEERVEGAKRKMKKILKPSTSFESLEAKMWDEAHLRAMEKAKRLEDSIRKGESVSTSDLYSVGTPCNNLLPSRRNTWVPGGKIPSIVMEEGPAMSSLSMSALDAAAIRDSSLAASYTPKHTAISELRRSSGGEMDEESHRGEVPQAGSHRGSGIVAEETENDDIFAKLVLDDSTTRRDSGL